RVAVIGVGLHGQGIAKALLDQGGLLTGASDPAHAGRLLSDVLGHPQAPATAIVADGVELLGKDQPDVVIITAPVDLEGLGKMSLPFLDAGVNVLTIHPDAFDPPEAWGALIDEASVLGGPMRVLARKLGLTPGEPERECLPLLAKQPMAWKTGQIEVQPGHLIGFVETIRVDTEEGVEFSGEMRLTLLGPG